MGFKERAELHKFDAAFEGVRITGDKLQKGMRSWPVAECEAMVDHGANIAARVTATRVAIGTVLLPGIGGTIVGALAKKNRNKVYLAVTVPDDDVVLVELKAKKEGKARAFANKVNQAAAHFQQRQETAAPSAKPASKAAPPPPPGVPAGWYPQGDVQRYWDGSSWTDHTAPLAQ